MKRDYLLYNSDDDAYLAGSAVDLASGGWEDVTECHQHARRAVLRGVWIGSGPLPSQLCLSGLEHGQQTALMAWAGAVANLIEPRLSLLYAIPNGGKRDKLTAAMLKSEGVKSGVPDLFFPVPVVASTELYESGLFSGTIPFNGVVCGLYIEMKRLKGGVLSDNQIKWATFLRAAGYAVVRANTWREAANFIIGYLEIKS